VGTDANQKILNKQEHTYNGLFSRKTLVSWHKKAKPFCILMKQEMMGWQWHQLHHVQVIGTSLQIINNDSTSSLNFLQTECSS